MPQFKAKARYSDLCVLHRVQQYVLATTARPCEGAKGGHEHGVEPGGLFGRRRLVLGRGAAS